MRVALDTNILAYAEGTNGAEMRDRAVGLLRALSSREIVIPVQVLGELFNVLVRKAGRSRTEARAALLGWRDAFATAPTLEECVASAADLSAEHSMAIWDAIVLVVAARSGCQVLLSEDMHSGFTWSGITIVNPFATAPHPLLAALKG